LFAPRPQIVGLATLLLWPYFFKDFHQTRSKYSSDDVCAQFWVAFVSSLFFLFFFEQTVFQGQVSYNLKRAWKRLLLCKKKTNENELTFKTS